MKYFEDTDTAVIEFSEQSAHEIREINENISIDLDKNGNLVGMTIEHAKTQANMNELLFQQMSAG